jgi:hypothetical protein
VQGSNPSKAPKMISVVKNLITKYQEALDNYFPIVYTKVDFISLGLEEDIQKSLKIYIRTLKKDVSFRFTNLSFTLCLQAMDLLHFEVPLTTNHVHVSLN